VKAVERLGLLPAMVNVSGSGHRRLPACERPEVRPEHIDVHVFRQMVAGNAGDTAEEAVGLAPFRRIIVVRAVRTQPNAELADDQRRVDDGQDELLRRAARAPDPPSQFDHVVPGHAVRRRLDAQLREHRLVGIEGVDVLARRQSR